MIDSVAAVSFDMVAQSANAGGGAGAASGGKVSVHDVAHFESLHNKAATQVAEPAAASTAESANGFNSVLKSLQTLNGRVENMGNAASQISASNKELTPGDMIQMTVKAHEFMFQCELTANVANRSSEGVQQLFRQQS